MTNTTNLPSLPPSIVTDLVSLRFSDKEGFYSLVKALRLANWPLRAIGEPFKVSRTAVSDWESKYTGSALQTVPGPPEPARKDRTSGAKKMDMPSEEAADLLRLAKEASTVRRYTDANAPARHSADLLESKLRVYSNSGYSRAQLAKYCEVSPSSIAQRLRKFN